MFIAFGCFWCRKNEMHSLGRSVWKHHPISSQCCDFIIHFQNPYPLKYEGNQLSLYAFQIPLQGFLSCFSWHACNYRRCLSASPPPASCPCSRDFKRGTSEKCPLFLPREGSSTPSAYSNHFGNNWCSLEGPMACSFSARWRILWANTPSFPFPCFFWCLIMPRFFPDVSYFLFPHITHDSSSGRVLMRINMGSHIHLLLSFL